MIKDRMVVYGHDFVQICGAIFIGGMFVFGAVWVVEEIRLKYVVSQLPDDQKPICEKTGEVVDPDEPINVWGWQAIERWFPE